MNQFISKVIVYLICFVISLIGLSAFDFARFIKKNKVIEAWILYYVIAFIMAYILGQFIMDVVYLLN